MCMCVFSFFAPQVVFIVAETAQVLFRWKTDLTSKETPNKLLRSVNKLFTLGSNMRNIMQNVLGHS